MPKDEGLSPAKKASLTKGPEGHKAAGREMVSTKTIQKAQKKLAAIAAELDAVRQLLGKVETKEKRGKPAKQGRKSPSE